MVRVEWLSESEKKMTNTEITAFLTQNRATKAKAIVEILTKDDAAACLAAALQLLPGGDDRESVVELIVGLADIPTIRDALAIHAPNWGGAAAREMGRRASQGDEVAQCVLLAIAKADDGNGVSFAECFIAPPPGVGDAVEILSNDTHPHKAGMAGVIKQILKDRPGYGADPVDVVEVGTDEWGVFLPIDKVRRV